MLSMLIQAPDCLRYCPLLTDAHCQHGENASLLDTAACLVAFVRVSNLVNHYNTGLTVIFNDIFYSIRALGSSSGYIDTVFTLVP